MIFQEEITGLPPTGWRGMSKMNHLEHAVVHQLDEAEFVQGKLGAKARPFAPSFALRILGLLIDGPCEIHIDHSSSTYPKISRPVRINESHCRSTCPPFFLSQDPCRLAYTQSSWVSLAGPLSRYTKGT